MVAAASLLAAPLALSLEVLLAPAAPSLAAVRHAPLLPTAPTLARHAAPLLLMQGGGSHEAPLELTRPLAVRRTPPRMQGSQGPLEEGFKEILPFATEEGNVDPDLVDRVNDEVFALMGVGLEDLLNPSKVVNYEREKILLTQQIADCTDARELDELQIRLNKVESQLYSEKRTVFSGALKAVFVGQAIIAIVLGGFAAFDAFPWFTIDISLRALGFWSFWLFTIPSLRARRPRGWEKRALNYAFLGSPILTIGLPFVARDPPLIWEANLALLVGCYVYGYAFGRGDDAAEAGSFSGALRWLDFGSGQERGIRGAARDRYFDKLNQQEQEQEQQQAAPTQRADGASAREIVAAASTNADGTGA